MNPFNLICVKGSNDEMTLTDIFDMGSKRKVVAVEV